MVAEPTPAADRSSESAPIGIGKTKVNDWLEIVRSRIAFTADDDIDEIRRTKSVFDRLSSNPNRDSIEYASLAGDVGLDEYPCPYTYKPFFSFECECCFCRDKYSICQYCFKRKDIRLNVGDVFQVTENKAEGIRNAGKEYTLSMQRMPPKKPCVTWMSIAAGKFIVYEAGWYGGQSWTYPTVYQTIKQPNGWWVKARHADSLCYDLCFSQCGNIDFCNPCPFWFTETCNGKHSRL